MNNSTDPLTVLHGDELPVQPDPAFAARLRARLESALSLPNRTQGVVMSDTDTAIAELNEPAVEPMASTPPRAAAVPYLAVANAREAIAWYVETFGAALIGEIYEMDDGRIGHAELQIGDSRLFLADEFPEYGSVGPDGRSPVTIHLYVTDADAAFARAVEAGATVAMPLADMFWGDRFGKLVDPFGHHWSIAEHLEDLTPEQMQERMAAAMTGAPCG